MTNIELELIDEFSLWLSDRKYILNHVSGMWSKDLKDKPKLMSDLYQMFIEETQ